MAIMHLLSLQFTTLLRPMQSSDLNCFTFLCGLRSCTLKTRICSILCICGREFNEQWFQFVKHSMKNYVKFRQLIYLLFSVNSSSIVVFWGLITTSVETFMKKIYLNTLNILGQESLESDFAVSSLFHHHTIFIRTIKCQSTRYFRV